MYYGKPVIVKQIFTCLILIQTSKPSAIMFVLGELSSQHATRPCGGSTNPFSSNPFGQPSTATATATGVPHQVDTGNPFSESNLIVPILWCMADQSHHSLLFLLPVATAMDF